MTCDMCHAAPATIERLCVDCAAAVDYYDNLTPAERQAEDEAMARYVEESATWA